MYVNEHCKPGLQTSRTKVVLPVQLIPADLLTPHEFILLMGCVTWPSTVKRSLKI